MDESHAEMYPRKRSRVRAPLTDEELEVANLLYELPERILEIKRRSRACVLPRWLRWGSRKPRTLPEDEQNDDPPGRRRSPPPQPRQPPVVVEEKMPEICPAAVMTSSPSTPLSFPGSGGEDNTNNDAAVSAAAVRTKVPVFKSSKERNEWMEEQCRGIASLTQSNATLHQDIEKYRALLHGLTSEFHQLRLRESTMPRVEAPADAPESENAVSQWLGAQCPLPSDRELKPVMHLPDLNEPAAEAAEEPSSATAMPPAPPPAAAAAELRRQQDKGTAYAEARRRAKRRLELQRERSSPSGRRASDPSISNTRRPR